MTIELLPLADYQAGTTLSPEVEISDATRSYVVHLARCTDDAPDVWPDAEQLLRVQVEVFLDGAWWPWGAFEAFGGKHARRDSLVAESSSLRAGLNDVRPGRRLRASLTADAPVRTGLTLEVL